MVADIQASYPDYVAAVRDDLSSRIALVAAALITIGVLVTAVVTAAGQG